MTELSLKNQHQRQKIVPYLQQIDELMLDSDEVSVGDNTRTDWTGAIDGNNEVLSSTQQRLLQLKKQLKSEFLQYLDQLPIIRLNSQFNNLNLMRAYLLTSL